MDVARDPEDRFVAVMDTLGVRDRHSGELLQAVRRVCSWTTASLTPTGFRPTIVSINRGDRLNPSNRGSGWLKSGDDRARP
jgi:hypothetical protein